MQKVLIIGGGPSYFDIAKRISPQVKGDILVSTIKPLSLLNSKNQQNLSTVKQFLSEKGDVSFTDGTIEHGIEMIILCTGYQYEYPFLPMLQLSGNGLRLCELWKQMFWIPDPTLTFVGLPKMSAIFTVVEAQSAYIARALAGRLPLPYKSAMQQELEEEHQELKKKQQNWRKS
jgi:Flavin-binding monooxygenase-like